MAIRIKHNYTNPYHEWAHQTLAGTGENYGHNSSRNRSFKGLNAFSYGAEIARIVTNKKGKQAFLITTERWSPTTDRHQREVRAAIPVVATSFYVPVLNENYRQHNSNIDYYLDEIIGFLGKAKRARIEYYKDSYNAVVVRLRQDLLDYCKFFGVKAPKLNELNLQTLVARKDELRKLELTRERAEQAKRVKDAQEAIAAWQNSEPYSQVPYLLKSSYARITERNGETFVETSRHATVPIAHVVRAMPLILKYIQEGKEFITNGHTIHLGQYKLERIKTDGTVIIGCHTFEKEEVLRIAGRIQEWQKVNV